MTNNFENQQIIEKVNKEIDDKWLVGIIKKIYYLEQKRSLTQEEIDKIIRQIYFDIAREYKDVHIDNDLQRIEIIRKKIYEYIGLYEVKNGKRKQRIHKYKQNLIALTTLLTLLIAIPTGMIAKNRRNNRDVQYRTKSSECSFDIVNYDDGGYEYKQNVYTYHTAYKPANPSNDMVKIIDDGAWVVEGKEAYKSIKTYSLFDVSYGEIVLSGDIDKYIKGIIPSEEVKWIYQNKLKDQEKNQARIYRIVREVQDLNDGIVVYSDNSNKIKIIITLLVELFLLAYVIDYNNAFISEEIVGLISQIITNNKISQEEEKILNELREKYKKIGYLASEVKEKSRKRNYAK